MIMSGKVKERLKNLKNNYKIYEFIFKFAPENSYGKLNKPSSASRRRHEELVGNETLKQTIHGFVLAVVVPLSEALERAGEDGSVERTQQQ